MGDALGFMSMLPPTTGDDHPQPLISLLPPLTKPGPLPPLKDIGVDMDDAATAVADTMDLSVLGVRIAARSMTPFLSSH